MAGDPIFYVIDDDEAARDALSFLLGAARRRVRAFAGADEFLAALDGLEPGCVITDVRMPGMSGMELLQHLKARAKSGFPVIVITGHGDVALAVEAMKAGAADFLEKPYDDERLLAAAAAAIAAQNSARARDAERDEARRLIATLSGREREVLDGLVAGQANKVIALDLGISPRTVEIYRANVMTKLNADSLSDLVRTAMLALDRG